MPSGERTSLSVKALASALRSPAWTAPSSTRGSSGSSSPKPASSDREGAELCCCRRRHSCTSSAADRKPVAPVAPVAEVRGASSSHRLRPSRWRGWRSSNVSLNVGLRASSSLCHSMIYFSAARVVVDYVEAERKEFSSIQSIQLLLYELLTSGELFKHAETLTVGSDSVSVSISVC